MYYLNEKPTKHGKTTKGLISASVGLPSFVIYTYGIEKLIFCHQMVSVRERSHFINAIFNWAQENINLWGLIWHIFFYSIACKVTVASFVLVI